MLTIRCGGHQQSKKIKCQLISGMWHVGSYGSDKTKLTEKNMEKSILLFSKSKILMNL